MIYLQIKCQTGMVFRKNFISQGIRQIDTRVSTASSIPYQIRQKNRQNAKQWQ